MENQTEKGELLPSFGTITYETEDEGIKTASMDVLLSSGEKVSLKFRSRNQGKQQLLEKALTAPAYESLYEAITNISEEDLKELTEDEIADLIQNPPEGYTLDDYKKSTPENDLIIEGNPVGVEYTLTFGTGMGKVITHGGSGYDIYQLKLANLQHNGNGQSAEAEECLMEMRKRIHMQRDYNRLTQYVNPKRYNGIPELQNKVIAEIRAFRKLHPWVYEDIIREHERSKEPKKTFRIIRPDQEA